MDPMDVRYNQIYWVDRDERGYSTGGGLTDPRTGEMIAARVRLESDRVRTSSRYWQSYDAIGAGGGDDHATIPLPAYSTPDTEQQLSLLRQALLTAHEVGHSLGFDHNWSSSMNDRASVMEYPSPRIKIVNGKIDLTDAYPETDRRLRHHDGPLRVYAISTRQGEGGFERDHRRHAETGAGIYPLDRSSLESL